MSGNTDIYERHDLCQDLKPGDLCFRSKTYSNGVHTNDLHEHIPAHRISQDDCIAVLRSLAARYAGWSGESILHSHLNRRPGGPSRSPAFLHHISYPQPGVIRHYVSAGNTHAWLDRIVSPEKFAGDA